MVVLAVDTSQKLGSVALAGPGITGDDGAPGIARTFGEASAHLVGLGVQTEALLAAANLTIADVDRIALVIGPGSFTGLRVGLSFVKGLVAARGMSLVTMGTLELLARAQRDRNENVGVMVDARRGEVYCAAWDGDGNAIVEPAARSARAFVAMLPEAGAHFVGSGARVHAADVTGRFPDASLGSAEDEQPSSRLLASLAPELEPIPHGDVARLEPAYLRASGAERKRLKPIDRGGSTP